MSYETILVEHGKIARVKLNKPEKRNALSALMMKEIADALYELDKDDKVNVIILSGEGKGFCAGAELDTMSGGIEDSRKSKSNLVYLLKAMTKISKVIICQVQGFALAGGFGVMATADLTIVADNAKLGMPEIKRGLFPFTIMANLSRILPQKKLLEMAFTGDNITPQEALACGLVNKVVAPEELEKETMLLAETIAKYSSVALGLGKEAFYTMRDMEYYTSMDYLIEMLTIISQTEDAKEGIQAFFEKRDPVWKADR
jgi:enoyl-CoA hydratase/carnithine racemase